MSNWTANQLDGFHKAAQSLKLYRRADLQDEETGSSLIDELYVDPLPNNHVLQTTLKANTTFLIGRKGTGKSTVFQRAQHELRKSSSSLSVYIDIKTIFESSQVDPYLMEKADALSSSTISATTLRQLLLYKTFLSAVITDIQNELEARVRHSLWEKLKQTFSGSFDDLFVDLNELLDEANDDRFMSILGVKSIEVQTKENTEQQSQFESKASVTVASKPGMGLSATSKDAITHTAGEQQGYSDILMVVFNIKDLLLRLKELLSKISVKRLYIFVDDFSELPEEAMRVVVDTLLAPLNNWSEELIKFKIAAYPGRVYYGNIDKTKIDEISLDLYALYGISDVAAMEEKAIDFTRRIISRRLEAFCGVSAEVFFADSRTEDLWQSLFYATMANPRNLGYVLFYLYESQLIYGNTIHVRAIREAARRYYEDKIEPYFAMNRFLHESFHERSSIFSLKELLEAIVKRARELRSHRGSLIMSTLSEISGRPPTSHFHVVMDVEALLSTLELNFFLTRYFEMSDRDGRKVSVFALNYGLCQKYTLEFGRPKGKREFRTYFVERVFDYTPILLEYMNANQEVFCDACDERFSVEQIPALKLYGMQCPTCKNGVCKVINLSKKYETILRGIEPELLLPKTELGILQTLKTEDKPLYAQQIAAELDCSYQLIGRRGKNLNERLLVDRERDEQGRRQFSITAFADQQYFARATVDNLDVGEE
jgi:predicted AAA+ superfamily ATPase